MAQAVLQVLASGQRGALATVVRTSGSTPQQPGARLLLMPDGTFVADQVLAKHDENYMPPDAADAVNRARSTLRVSGGASAEARR